MSHDYLNDSPPLSSNDDVYGEKVPQAVELLVSYLEVAGLSTPELFAGDPSVSEINSVIDALRAGRSSDVGSVTRGSVRLAGASLAAYIRQLPAPLLLPPHYEALCASMDADSYGERIASVRDRVAEMPESHQSVLHRLFHFLSKLAERSTAPGNSAEELVSFWVGMMCPMHERGRGLLRNEHRLVGLMLQQYACIFEGSLDAMEAPELALPPHLAAAESRRATGGWQRIKASLLRDSAGQFKIQVREDECGIYLDVIAPTDVSDDRGKLAQRDYLVSLQRHKVEELTLAAVRSMIRDAGSILEMEVRRYVTEASEAARADQTARAERERREAAQLERYQQSVAQFVEAPLHHQHHASQQQQQHQYQQQPHQHQHQPPQPQPPQQQYQQQQYQHQQQQQHQQYPHQHQHQPPHPQPPQHQQAQPSPQLQQPTSVRYAARQNLSLDKLPTAARPEPDLWARNEPASATLGSALADLLGLEDLLGGPIAPAPAQATLQSLMTLSTTGSVASASPTFRAGDRALYRNQAVTVLTVHVDDPSGEYFTVRLASGASRDVEGPLQPLNDRAQPPACWGADAFSRGSSHQSLCGIGASVGASSTGSLPGNAAGGGFPPDGAASFFPPSSTDPFTGGGASSASAGWPPQTSPRDSLSSCGSSAAGASSAPPGSLLDADLFGPNTPIVSAKCPPPPPGAAAPKPPSGIGGATARASAPLTRRTSGSSAGAPALPHNDPFGDRNKPWVPFDSSSEPGASGPGSASTAGSIAGSSVSSAPPFRDHPPPPPPGAPPTREGLRRQREAATALAKEEAVRAEASRLEREAAAKEAARKATEERERRKELERLEGVSRAAETAVHGAEAEKAAEVATLAGLSRDEKRARIRTYIEREQRLKREAADAGAAVLRERERLERDAVARKEAAERAAREAAEAARLEEVRSLRPEPPPVFLPTTPSTPTGITPAHQARPLRPIPRCTTGASTTPSTPPVFRPTHWRVYYGQYTAVSPPLPNRRVCHSQHPTGIPPAHQARLASSCPCRPGGPPSRFYGQYTAVFSPLPNRCARRFVRSWRRRRRHTRCVYYGQYPTVFSALPNRCARRFARSLRRRRRRGPRRRSGGGRRRRRKWRRRSGAGKPRRSGRRARLPWGR